MLRMLRRPPQALSIRSSGSRSSPPVMTWSPIGRNRGLRLKRNSWERSYQLPAASSQPEPRYGLRNTDYGILFIPWIPSRTLTTGFTDMNPSTRSSRIRRGRRMCVPGVIHGSSRGSGTSLSFLEMRPIYAGTGIEDAGSRSSAESTDQATPGSHRTTAPSTPISTAMRSTRRIESELAARRILSALSSSKFSHGRVP